MTEPVQRLPAGGDRARRSRCQVGARGDRRQRRDHREAREEIVGVAVAIAELPAHPIDPQAADRERTRCACVLSAAGNDRRSGRRRAGRGRHHQSRRARDDAGTELTARPADVSVIAAELTRVARRLRRACGDGGRDRRRRSRRRAREHSVGRGTADAGERFIVMYDRALIARALAIARLDGFRRRVRRALHSHLR